MDMKGQIYMTNCENCFFFHKYFSNKEQKEVKECNLYWNGGHFIKDENKETCKDFREKK